MVGMGREKLPMRMRGREGMERGLKWSDFYDIYFGILGWDFSCDIPLFGGKGKGCYDYFSCLAGCRGCWMELGVIYNSLSPWA
jgi:hypothetical protein